MKNLIMIIIILNSICCIRIDGGRQLTKEQEYKGKLTKIYRDGMNHGMWSFIIKTNGDSINCVIETNFDESNIFFSCTMNILS